MKIVPFLIGITVLAIFCGEQSHTPSSSLVSATPQSSKSTVDLFRVYRGGKFGYINSKGEVVIEPKYSEAEKFSEGLALVRIDRQPMFIDIAGNIVIQPQSFDPTNGFQGGFARGRIITKPGIGGYIDKTGKLVIENESSGAYEFYEGVAVVDKHGLLGYMDNAGRVVIKPQFVDASPFSGGLAAVKWGDRMHYVSKWGFIDKTGKIVIEPQFDITGWFSEGLATIAFKGGVDSYRWGFVDKTGRVVIEPQFDWADSFTEGLAPVKVRDKWGFVDKVGSVVIAPQFDRVERFSEGLSAVAVSGKWGYIDKSGKFIIEPQFNEAMSFEKGLAFVKIGGYDANAIIDVLGTFDPEGKWGYIDKTGKYIWQPTN